MTSARPSSKILVVDDDKGLLHLMAEVLRAEGYTVHCAHSGAVMLEQVARHQPELLLLDLKLKGVNGEVLLQQLVQKGQRIPFIVITGQGDEKVAVEMMRRGALDYLSKSTALLDLLPNVVSRALTKVSTDRALALERAERERLEREAEEAVKKEQRRIGQDLHDGLGQQLTAIEILCAGLKEDVAGDTRLTTQVEQIARMLRASISQVRTLARGLVPLTDQPNALWDSLVELVQQANSLGRTKCRFDCPRVVLLHDQTMAGYLFRIAQEAVNNAVKHSRAKRIIVSLVRRKGALVLTVSDNGCGFVTAGVSGLGLQVMRHRADTIGAELTVETFPARGTTIRCRLPMKK